jgi:hypothetical protein
MKLGCGCKRFVFDCANEIAFPSIALFRRPGAGVKSLQYLRRAREPQTAISSRCANKGGANVPVRLGHPPISLYEFGKIRRSPQLKQRR